jgi:hypothetical protein
MDDPKKTKPKSKPGSVDDQADDSFPASDPPSFNAGGHIGKPDNAGKPKPRLHPNK